MKRPPSSEWVDTRGYSSDRPGRDLIRGWAAAVGESAGGNSYDRVSWLPLFLPAFSAAIPQPSGWAMGNPWVLVCGRLRASCTAPLAWSSPAKPNESRAACEAHRTRAGRRCCTRGHEGTRARGAMPMRLAAFPEPTRDVCPPNEPKRRCRPNEPECHCNPSDPERRAGRTKPGPCASGHSSRISRTNLEPCVGRMNGAVAACARGAFPAGAKRPGAPMDHANERLTANGK
jgi:hypothetical protein